MSFIDFGLITFPQITHDFIDPFAILPKLTLVRYLDLKKYYLSLWSSVLWNSLGYMNMDLEINQMRSNDLISGNCWVPQLCIGCLVTTSILPFVNRDSLIQWEIAIGFGFWFHIAKILPLLFINLWWVKNWLL